jgi:hypothetical protein
MALRSFMSNFDLLIATRKERELMKKQEEAHQEEVDVPEQSVSQSSSEQERSTQPTA